MPEPDDTIDTVYADYAAVVAGAARSCLNRANRPFPGLDPETVRFDGRDRDATLRYLLAVGDALGFAIGDRVFSGTWGDVLRCHPLFAALGSNRDDSDRPARLAALGEAMRDQPPDAVLPLLDQADPLARAEEQAERNLADSLAAAGHPADIIIPDADYPLRSARRHPECASRLVRDLALRQGMARDALDDAAAAVMPSPDLPDGKLAPHIALITTLLDLTKTATIMANALPARHYRYFLENHLGLAPDPMLPDEAVVVLTVPEDSPALTLPAGFLYRGASPSGAAVAFAQQEACRVSAAAIRQVQSVAPPDGGGPFFAIRPWNSYPDDNGITAWTPFVADTLVQDCRVEIPLDILDLHGGDREVVVSLTHVRPGSTSDDAARLAATPPPFDIAGITTDGIPLPASTRVTWAATDNLTLVVHMTFLRDQPPILRDADNGEPPCLRLSPRQAPSGWWPDFMAWTLERVHVRVSVVDLPADRLIRNGEEFPPAHPIACFGVDPVGGDALEIVADELAGRCIDTLIVSWLWPGMPAALTEYFKEYSKTFRPINLQGQQLIGGRWCDAGTKQSLNTPSDDDYIFDLSGNDNRLDDGRCRIVLCPGGSLFGQSVYASLLTQASLNAMTCPSNHPCLKDLHPPLIPEWTDIRFEYAASAELGPGEFTIRQILPEGEQTFTSPAAPWSGCAEYWLMLGIADASPGALSLYFRLDDGEADEPPGPTLCQILDNNRWEQLSLCPGSGDGTDGLTHSGRMTLSLPSRAVTSPHTIWPAELTWLRFRWPDANRSRALIGIHPHAVAVIRQADGESETGDWPLPANCITGADADDPPLDSVVQPYPSEGGRPPRSGADFHQATAERLRHRGRAVTAWDYERLVLDQFAAVTAVRCLPRAVVGSDGRVETKPQNVTVGVFIPPVPPARSDPGQPCLPKGSLINLIATTLREQASPYAIITVRGPHYDPVVYRLTATVRPCQSLEDATRSLTAALTCLLVPWSVNSDAPVLGQAVTGAELAAILYRPEFLAVDEFVLECRGERIVVSLDEPLIPDLLPANPIGLFTIDPASRLILTL